MTTTVSRRRWLTSMMTRVMVAMGLVALVMTAHGRRWRWRRPWAPCGLLRAVPATAGLPLGPSWSRPWRFGRSCVSRANGLGIPATAGFWGPCPVIVPLFAPEAAAPRAFADALRRAVVILDVSAVHVMQCPHVYEALDRDHVDFRPFMIRAEPMNHSVTTEYEEVPHGGLAGSERVHVAPLAYGPGAL